MLAANEMHIYGPTSRVVKMCIAYLLRTKLSISNCQLSQLILPVNAGVQTQASQTGAARDVERVALRGASAAAQVQSGRPGPPAGIDSAQSTPRQDTRLGDDITEQLLGSQQVQSGLQLKTCLNAHLSEPPEQATVLKARRFASSIGQACWSWAALLLDRARSLCSATLTGLFQLLY